jgi:predicted protein tyrosine phosphatase
MILVFLIPALLINVSGEELLSEVSERYAAADGIQWRLRSVVYSEIFEESDTTYIEFSYAPPDTFSLVSDKEKILGVADTLWVMSSRHHQVQKKNIAGTVMPAEFIFSWKDDYDLDGYSRDESSTTFELTGKEGIEPSDLTLVIDRKKKIKMISYFDSKGDKVTLAVKREGLDRPVKFDLFFLDIPEEYDFIDLTE